jgi:ribonuclease HI
VIIAPNGVYINLSVRLEFAYTNNQVEYESLLHGLENLRDLGASVTPQNSKFWNVTKIH